jgi:hypothetical protein
MWREKRFNLLQAIRRSLLDAVNEDDNFVCGRDQASTLSRYCESVDKEIRRLDSCVASVIELAFSGCMGRRYLLKNKIENATKLLQTRPE